MDLGRGQGALLDAGVVGVVLSNQSDQNLCGWLPAAKVLAAHGLRVLLHDYVGGPVDDIAAAAAKLRALGARTVVLVDASEGAKASLAAATTVRPPVAGVVAISPEQYLQASDMIPARLRVPVLYLTARDDVVVDDAPNELYKASARAPWRRLLVLPGTAHGTDLLKGAGGVHAQALLLDFLQRHGR